MLYAGEKHRGQQVPGTDANYLLHISNVTMEVLLAYQYKRDFDLDFAMQMAILHDTIEDTTVTFEDIEAFFGSRVAIGVQALTKNSNISNKAERMLDSLNRVNVLEKEVGIVKLADRITNLQAPPSHWSKEKIQKYCDEAKVIASALSGKNAYLNNRLHEKIKSYQNYV